MPKPKSKKHEKSINRTAAGPFGVPITTSAEPAKHNNFLENPMGFIHDHVGFLNNSKFFAGIVMILLNVGSKVVSIQFSKSTEEYLKSSLTRQLLIFAMAWMGTRDIYVALALTAIFVVLSDHLFNEESDYCVVPHHYRVLNKIMDTNGDGIVSDSELNNAIMTLEKAKREKQRKMQKEAFSKFNYEVLQDNAKL